MYTGRTCMICCEANGSFSGEPDVDVGATCSACSDTLVHYLIIQCLYMGLLWIYLAMRSVEI